MKILCEISLNKHRFFLEIQKKILFKHTDENNCKKKRKYYTFHPIPYLVISSLFDREQRRKWNLVAGSKDWLLNYLLL